MLSTLHFQIIIDAIFFVTIVILLRQLNKRIVKEPPVIDESIIRKFEKLMMESKDVTNQFLRVIEENEQRLNKLSRQLDNKEKKLVILIEEADAVIGKSDLKKANRDEMVSDEDRPKLIMKMIQEGTSREEIVKRLGVTEGEMNLITALAQIKEGNR